MSIVSAADLFVDAVVDMFPRAPRRKIMRLRAAANALVEELASRASVQSASVVGPLFVHQEQTDARADTQQRHMEAIDVRERAAEDRLDSLEARKAKR